MNQRSDQELPQISVDLYHGKIFCDAQVRNENQLPMVFMPLLLGGLKDWKPEDIKDIGMLFEYIDQAGPRAVNGYPNFISMKIMSKAEVKIMFEHYDAYEKINAQFVFRNGIIFDTGYVALFSPD